MPAPIVFDDIPLTARPPSHFPRSNSKLPSDQIRDGIAHVLAKSQEKPRKFTETIELQIGLKNYDPQKDKRFNGTVALPTSPALSSSSACSATPSTAKKPSA